MSETNNDQPLRRWTVVFSRGARGNRQTLQICIQARTPSAARKYGIESAASQGAGWVASAQATVRKELP